MHEELMTLGRLALFMTGMIVIALPVAVAWASLRGSALTPAIVYLSVLVSVAMWITGGAR